MAELLDHLRRPHERKAFLREVAREAANEGDFDAFIASIGYVPHERQRQFHATRGLARRRLPLGGRRSGKTLSLGVECAYEVCCGTDERDAGRVLLLAPVGELSERTWRVATGILCRQLGFRPVRKSDSPVRREVCFEWGGTLVCRSAQGEDPILGDSYTLAVLDEAARIGSRISESSVQPSLLDSGGTAIFASTPTSPGTWYHQLWKRAEDPDDQREPSPAPSRHCRDEEELLGADVGKRVSGPMGDLGRRCVQRVVGRATRLAQRSV